MTTYSKTNLADKLLLAKIKRSDEWPAVRRRYIKKNPACVVCGARKRLTAHHIIPYHIDPALELVETNLITLCEPDHLLFGHLRRYLSYNENVVVDAHVWNYRILHRPKWRM